MDSPSNDFVKLFLQPFYKGAKTQAVIEKFRPILKSAIKEYISETVNDRIKFALESAAATPADDARIFTEEEWESVTLVKDIAGCQPGRHIPQADRLLPGNPIQKQYA